MTDRTPLLEVDADPDPYRQFERWYAQALAGGLVEPTAMALATADASGRPSVRMVLLKGHDARGFVFYSNYASRKGEDLAANPYAALLWWWDRLERQVRVEGTVEKLGRAESEAYFHSRPRGAQLSALASPQSRVVPDRAALERRVAELAQLHAHGPVPLPDDWGGYRVRPDRFEFWQGRRDRLHDRLRYTRAGGGWRLERLGP
ncbi:MAG TPA: pyridoxamine 5'-phosphate oxidase [Nevskiales bacterium]|nr:pyridoxamine 5'-phosphate oxidase [Nevskiales bacterium]